jgi:hypothetical protein
MTDLVGKAVRAADRPSQRDLLRRVAADHRVLHVEVGEGDAELGRALEANAARRIRAADALASIIWCDVAGTSSRSAPAVEHQQARIRLFDDRDIDAADLRTRLPFIESATALIDASAFAGAGGKRSSRNRGWLRE